MILAAICGPQTTEVAAELIAAAKAAGLPASVVETVDGGYRVPLAVAQAADTPKVEAPKPRPAAKKTTASAEAAE
jgi:hypothetical protein